MTLIALVRHGQTDWNLNNRIQGISDIPLNDTGRAQAAQAAALLRSEEWALGWTAALSSPLSRAVETARVIADELALPVLPVRAGLAERDYGVVEGMDVDLAQATYPDHAYPEAEAPDTVIARALGALGSLHEQHEGQRLVAVAHGGLLHGLLSHINGARVASIANTAVSLVEFDATQNRWDILAINNEMLPRR